MIKICNNFQHHQSLFSKSTKNISYDDIINYISSEKSDIDTECRLSKLSLLEYSNKLLKKSLLNEDFKLNIKFIKENGLDNLPEVIKFKELKEAYDKIKTKLPLILCSITTSNKDTKMDSIESYNNKIVIDIDNISLQGKDINELFNKVKSDVFCEFAFISPGGDGLKLFYEIDVKEEISQSNLFLLHKWAYDYISEYVSKTYDISLDKSTSNLNRSCLLSRGYQYYYNEDKSPVELFDKWKKSKKTPTTTISKKDSGSIDYLITEFISYFDNNPTDLFTDRLEWVKLSYFLIKFKGESGRPFFQKMSSYSSNYNANACNKLYDNSLKTFTEERLGTHSERWLFKIMTDNGFVPKTTDRVLKSFKWKESDYQIMIKKLGYTLIEDEITGKFFLEKDEVLNELNDSHYNQLITDLRLTFNDQFKENTLKTYIFSDNNIVKKNFIKEKIEKLTYDKPDEFNKIFDYIDTEENKSLVRNIFLRWGLGVIQNIYDSYYDEILVLKSKQGLGKTTWIQNYFTNYFSEWTTTSFNYDIKNPDDMKLLSDKMFIYDTENISMKKADNQIIKKITSTSHVDYRRPYDRFSITKKRIASFIMDTNEDIIFNDITGGRRFLIISILSMNIYDKDGGYLKKIDYEKVWGYLYNLYKSGKRPGDIDITDINENIDNYRLKTDLENIIDELFTKSDSFELGFKQIKEYLNEYYSNNNIKFSTDDYTDTKIGRLLSQKFDKKRVKKNSNTFWFYNIKLKTLHTTHVYNSTDEGDLVDSILDEISKRGDGPNEKEIEILEKIRKNK
jgi:hypothetical protein